MKYNNIGLGIFILGFRLPSALGALRLDIGLRNVQVAEITADAKVDFDKQEVLFDDPDSSFDLPMRCKPSQGKRLTLSEDRKWAACCPPGTSLLGSQETAFDCCGAGHSLAGDEGAGYRCCPTGQVFDGDKCKKPNSSDSGTCKNGRVLVNGKCVCPASTTEAPDGTCKPTKCSSEVQYGELAVCWLHFKTLTLSRQMLPLQDGERRVSWIQQGLVRRIQAIPRCADWQVQVLQGRGVRPGWRRCQPR